MRHRLFAVALIAVSLGATGCDPKLFAQFTGASSLTNSQPPGQSPGASPSVAVPTPTPTTVSKQGVILNLAHDTYYEPYFTVYISKKFDFNNGAESSAFDFGQVEFASNARFQKEEDNGHFIYGRKYTNIPLDLGFIDKGQVDLSSVSEAPEYGWSSATGENRNRIKVKSGFVYLVRTQYRNSNENLYGKLLIKDLAPSKVVFDYVWQTATGSRAF